MENNYYDNDLEDDSLEYEYVEPIPNKKEFPDIPQHYDKPTPVEKTTFDAKSHNMKYCKFCGSLIAIDAVICTHCGRQVEELKISNNTPQAQGITINTTATSNPVVTSSPNINMTKRKHTEKHHRHSRMREGTEKNKWIALLLCVFLGYLGVHKFYEDKPAVGLLYLFTTLFIFSGFILIGTELHMLAAILLMLFLFIDFIILLVKPNPYYVR